MSGGASLGTLLVQRLDAVLGHAAASHPHMVSGVRRDAVTGPGAPQRTPVTDDSGRKPGPADDANTLVASALSRSRTAQAPTRTLPLAPPDRPNAPAAAEPDEPAEELDADAPQRRNPAPPPLRTQDARQSLGAALAPRTALPLFVGSPSAPTVLGQTARVIHTLLADGALDGQVLRSIQPLLTAPDARAPAPLAAQLKNMIELSGLFYERHLVELAFGRRDLRQLRAEPQARWSPTGDGTNASASAASNTPAPGTSPASPPAAASQGAPTPQPQSSSTPAAAASPQQAPPEPAVAAVPQDALTRMQLEALATQTIQWRGEAWDGAPMQWRIERDESQAADDEAQPWRTTLTLVLPRLGQVDIALSGADSRLSVRMDAREASTELDAHKTGLAARLQAHGLTAEIAVKRADTETLDDTLADARDSA